MNSVALRLIFGDYLDLEIGLTVLRAEVRTFGTLVLKPPFQRFCSHRVHEWPQTWHHWICIH